MKASPSSPSLEWDTLPSHLLDGIPLGNGAVGAVLWADAERFAVSLDHNEAWDERNDPRLGGHNFQWKHLRELIASGDHESIVRDFEENSDCVCPTKLAARRFYFSNAASLHQLRWTLDCESAVAKGLDAEGNEKIRCFVHAALPVFIIESNDASIPTFIPALGEESGNSIALGDSDVVISRPAGQLGYPRPAVTTEDRSGSFHQKTVSETEWVACWKFLDGVEGTSSLLVAVCFGKDANDRARSALEAAARQTREQLWHGHTDYWSGFWKQSSFTCEDPLLHQAWHVQHYLLGSTCRLGFAPIALQGVWSDDENQLPPWHGDYHNNANVQFSYSLCLTANRLEQSRNLVDSLINWMPAYQTFSQDFFNCSGLCAPAFHSLAGQAFPGWNTVLSGRFHGIWLLKQLWDHYCYTTDEELLKSVVWPFMEGLVEFAQNQFEPDADGFLHLPLGTSPEIGDNSIMAYMPDTNYEVSLVRFLFNCRIQAAEKLGLYNDAESARQTLAKLPVPSYVLVTSSLGQTAEVVGIAPDRALEHSHRHHSHLMHLYPLDENSLGLSPAPHDKSLEALHQLDFLGTGQWVGFSFPWMACLAARLGEANRADHYIRTTLNHFISGNGFNRNGDFRNAGVSFYKWSIFTLEANFLTAAAIQECCLQSHGGVIRVFPALPVGWGNVAFHGWRTEGAHRISASMDLDSLQITVVGGSSSRFALDVPAIRPAGSDAPRHLFNFEVKDHDTIQINLHAKGQNIITKNNERIPSAS